MTSELSKYLNEQLGVFLNVKQQKWRELKHIKKEFLNKTLYCIMKNFIKNLCYLGFWKFLTFSFKFFFPFLSGTQISTLDCEKQKRLALAVFYSSLHEHIVRFSYFSSSPIEQITVAIYRLFLRKDLNVYISMSRVN